MRRDRGRFRSYLLGAFKHFLADQKARDFTRRQIHADLFVAALGVEAAHRVLAVGDAQIQAGLELFDEAAKLLARRGTEREVQR